MHIAVIGSGYLGAVHATSLAESGHPVDGIDVDSVRIPTLAKDVVSFIDRGCDEILERNVSSGCLTFSIEERTQAGSIGSLADSDRMCETYGR